MRYLKPAHCIEIPLLVSFKKKYIWVVRDHDVIYARSTEETMQHPRVETKINTFTMHTVPIRHTRIFLLPSQSIPAQSRIAIEEREARLQWQIWGKSNPRHSWRRHYMARRQSQWCTFREHGVRRRGRWTKSFPNSPPIFLMLFSFGSPSNPPSINLRIIWHYMNSSIVMIHGRSRLSSYGSII